MEGFQKKFSELQINIIQAAYTLCEGKADTMFIGCAYEEAIRTTTADIAYIIDNKFIRMQYLPTIFNYSDIVNRRRYAIDSCIKDWTDLIDLYKDNDMDIPIFLKLTYSVKTKKLDADISYDPIEYEEGKAHLPDKPIEKWFEEEKAKFENN